MHATYVPYVESSLFDIRYFFGILSATGTAGIDVILSSEWNTFYDLPLDIHEWAEKIFQPSFGFRQAYFLARPAREGRSVLGEDKEEISSEEKGSEELFRRTRTTCTTIGDERYL